MDIFLNALCGAASCMVRLVCKKRENANDSFYEECTRKKRTVKTVLKRFQRSKKENTECWEKYVRERKKNTKNF